jgi:trigger factor
MRGPLPARVAELADAQALEACGATRAGSIPASRIPWRRGDAATEPVGERVVQSRVEDLSPVVKKVSVELTEDRVKDALDQAYTGLSRTVKLKGYRAGHVPRRLVERYFGEDVKKDVAQKLVNSSIGEALSEHKLEPVAPPRIETNDVNPGRPFKYVATVEVRPHVEPKDYLGLPVPKVDEDIDERMIESEIENLRQSQSMFVPVEGRESIELGDFAAVDYEGFLNGEPLKGAQRENVLLEVAPGSILDSKAEELSGARVGETREIKAKFPPEYPAPALREKEGLFRVSVKGIKRREIPALDDQFVQDLGRDARTVDELREKLRADLAVQRKERAKQERREAILTALVERNPVEAPPALIERNIDGMLQTMMAGFQRRGIDAQRLGLNLDRMREELRPRAALEVKGYLLLEAIAEKEKLEATEEDLEKHYEKASGELGQPAENIKTAFHQQGAVEGLKARLRQDKALAFLLEKANLAESGASP